MKHSYLLTSKIAPDVNNFISFLKAAQELGDSSHVRRNYWYMIMASTNLI